MLKIQSTRDYRLFLSDSGENRPLDAKKHKKLEESMRKYGFLQCFPIIVIRNKAGKLIIRDGQHRFEFAEALKLPVYYVEDPSEFDLAEINSTSEAWKLIDYAQRHARNGSKPYEEGLEFMDRHKIAIGSAFALLAGTSSYSNIRDQFIGGTFKVKDRAWAEAVASLYVSLVGMSKRVRGIRLLEACMAVCRVSNFDAKRLLQGANRCHDKLLSYSTKEGYLDMLEDLYNFGRSQHFGLKSAAANAMRERTPAKFQKPAERNGAKPQPSAT